MDLAAGDQAVAASSAGQGTADSSERTRSVPRRYGPGLALVAAGVAIAYAASSVVPLISPLMFAVLLGAALANIGLYRPVAVAGVRWAARYPLRVGIVLLGLQLAVSDVLDLGWRILLVVVTSVFVTFFATRWLGRRLGLRSPTALLIATGMSVCGASAIAAMDEVAHGEGDDAATAIALATILGSVEIVALPLLRDPLGLSMSRFGAWAGAGVPEVAQVVAAAGAAGSAAVTTAVVVKLARVVMLAPLVAGTGLLVRRRAGGSGVSQGGKRPPIVPLFVVGFLAAVAVRATGVLPGVVLHAGHTSATLLLCAALFGLGTGVHLPRLIRTGGRPMVLGAASALLMCAISYVGVVLST